jgi:endonuclease YncB( thermonuclease family)
VARRPPQFDNHPMPYPAEMLFRGWCGHVVDGDTFDVLLDLGLNEYSYETVRLDGGDAWEIYGAEKEKGLLAKAFVEAAIMAKPVKITTRKDTQTFGRYVADCAYWVDGVEKNLLTELDAAGHLRHAA